jgi:hypothetical protein
MSIADLDTLLASGGDERLALDPVNGLNLYGHGPTPRPGDLAMGSSTASTISARAYRALATSHAVLAERVRRDGDLAAYRTEVAALRGRLRALFGLVARLRPISFSRLPAPIFTCWLTAVLAGSSALC